MSRQKRILYNQLGIAHFALVIAIVALFACGYAGYTVYRKSGMSAQAETRCVSWAGATSLQSAIDQNSCVQIEPGTYYVPKYIFTYATKTIQGRSGSRDTTILKPQSSSWNGNGMEGVINSQSESSTVTVKDLTIDSSGISTYALGSRGMYISNVRAKNARCFGIGIVGKNVTVLNSIIEKNGASCDFAPPGSGIYLEGSAASRGFNSIIKDNVIQDNIGPGIDSNGVNGVQLTNNTIKNNSSWAGVSIWGSSGWKISGNTISHPATKEAQPYHAECGGGAIGKGSAALILCQDVESATNSATIWNTIENNKLSGTYGILLIGNDEKNKSAVPRGNILKNNSTIGSVYGCADDNRVGQVKGNNNLWERTNICNGASKIEPQGSIQSVVVSSPTYF